MATFEQIKLALQVETVLENLRRDMRANAQSYLDQLTAGTSPAEIAPICAANTTQYKRILQWLLDANGDTTLKNLVTAGLTALSLLYSDVTAAYSEMNQAANAEQTAEANGLTTALSIQNLANATLTNVAAHRTLWPNG